MSLSVILGVGLVLYLVPALVAAIRHHHNQNAIFWLNVLLGWTALGWIAALIWAFTKPAPAQASEQPLPPPALADDLRNCPYCAELVKRAAIKCKHCGADLVAAP